MKFRILTLSLPLLMLLASCGHPAPTLNAADVETRVREKTRQYLTAGNWARQDGYTYTVDIGQLLTYAANTRDREMYQRLHDFCVRQLIRDDPGDASTRGFIAWRWRAGKAVDATGTTEALRVAEGLWRGATAFNDPADRDRAVMIVKGYARHQRTEYGIWLIANYYNFSDHTLATNSFVIDYDPDFVQEVAAVTNDPDLKDLAGKCAALVGSASTPAGLFYDLVQPEISTLLPRELAIFSPNDVVQLSNAATIAERTVNTNPQAARKLLNFAVAHGSQLNSFYYGRTGEASIARPAGAETTAALVRLAVKLNDESAIKLYLPTLLWQADYFVDHPNEPRLWFASEILNALQMANARK